MTEHTQNKDYDLQLIGKRVTIRGLDWKSALTGTLMKVERYAYVLKQDNGALLAILKHAVGAIGLAPVKEERGTIA
jgi:hypothetical protein